MATVPHGDHPARRSHGWGNLALSASQEVAGLACLLCGVILSITFILLPVGIPLALFGVALMATADSTGKHAH